MQADRIAMSASAPRYCPCGKRLAGDHAGPQCGACERRAVQQRAAPPPVPPGFWDTPAFRDALDAQNMGRLARAYRRHPSHLARYGRDGIPQELLGDWLGLTQAQVSRIENGPPIRNLDTLAHWARVLGIPPRLLWFRLPPGQDTAVPTAQLPSQPPAPAGLFQLVPVGDGALQAPDVAAMRAFRAADLQVGGGHLYATVTRYLQTEVASRLFGSADGADHRPVFTAAAALTEMAGWMAHDAGRDATAKNHFGRSLALAGVGGDRQLSAHVLGSMSHLASHLDQPDEAIALARQGQAVLRAGSAHPGLQARLLALEARGFAGQDSAGVAECVQLLVRAEKALGSPAAEPSSPWVSNFDEGSLASEAARCMRQLGDLDEARRQAEQIVALRPSYRTRSRAFGQLALVTVLIAQGRPEEACAIAYEVLAATQSLGSFLVISQLRALHPLLQPHRGSTAVTGFLDCLEETVRERLGLYRWLATDQHNQHSQREYT
jgi:transcriptional regulator with XRE-family HTH domain